MIKKLVYSIGKRLPPIKRLIDERDELRNKLDASCKFAPPGHFYSPIPSLEEIKSKESTIWGHLPESLKAIDLNEHQQLQIFTEFTQFYKDLPFTNSANSKTRYYYENPNYSYNDAITLYSMIRNIKPNRIIEVGSGYSSCVTLDTNELFFNNQIEINFIEPYPDLLLSLMRSTDKSKYPIIKKNLQDVELQLFGSLKENDILFIDSTHVSKIGSDVNYLFFEILPVLNKGVYIHFHDIFYPFEYPKDWMYEGRVFTENYILRAFLEYNSNFNIIYWNNYFVQFNKDLFTKSMPLCLKGLGASMWIKKMQ